MKPSVTLVVTYGENPFTEKHERRSLEWEEAWLLIRPIVATAHRARNVERFRRSPVVFAAVQTALYMAMR